MNVIQFMVDQAIKTPGPQDLYNGRHLTQHAIDAIFKLYDEGINMRTIALRLDLPVATVTQRIQSGNRTAVETRVSERRDEIVSLFSKGMTRSEIASKMGYSYPYVSKILRG